MKLQSLTVIFSIIIIPITLILSAYIGVQMDTILLSQKYDTRLIDATHDAVVAFELNTVNNKYSTNADSIRRDIKAAINTFSTSLAVNFGTSGAGKNSVMAYIPALVFTLYDGYYIYSPHEYNYEYNGEQRTGYEHILKPYIHYTGRYKTSSNNDIIVNYSLDNYVTIYGYLNGKYVSCSGYLIDTSKIEVDSNGNVIKYQMPGENKLNTMEIEKLRQRNEQGNDIESDSSASKQYYQEAYDFTKMILNDSSLKSVVTPHNAVRSDGQYYREYDGEFLNDHTEILNISSDNDPEKREAVFTQHKREIMKRSIQENLNNAIKVYNEHSPSMGTNANFKMPILTDEDWEKILTNVNMISFMQGIQVGTKIYNNYSIVTTTANKQYVNADSLYFIVDGLDTYHRINCPILEESINNNSHVVGYKSIELKRVQNSLDHTKYHYKHPEYACYTCVVNSLNEEVDEEVFKKLPKVLQESYYRALARERYDLDKITKMLKHYKIAN